MHILISTIQYFTSMLLQPPRYGPFEVQFFVMYSIIIIISVIYFIKDFGRLFNFVMLLIII